MKKSTRIILYALLLLGVGALVYQFLPINKKVMKIEIVEQPYVQGVLKGTVSNNTYKYVLVNLFEQDSTIYITEGNTTKSVGLHVFDTVDIVDGAFSYTYKQKEPYIFPRIIFLANDSGTCDLVSFQNPYFDRPYSIGGICMDRGGEISLTIDGNNLKKSRIAGSPGTDAIFKRDAENDAKSRAATASLTLKKKAAERAKKSTERAKQIQDSIQKSQKQFDTATMRLNGRNSKIYLKPKYR